MPVQSVAMRDSVESFRSIVTSEDNNIFNTTSLTEVRHAIIEIEHRLAEHGTPRDLHRLSPLLARLEAYAREAERSLDDSLPMLSWLWAPIMLYLRITIDHASVIECLVSMYKQIASALPVFNLMPDPVSPDPITRWIFNMSCCDVLAFHTKVYSFLKRSGWPTFFESWMTLFKPRFTAILNDLGAQARLVGVRLNPLDYIRFRDLREHRCREMDLQEAQQRITQLNEAQAWLRSTNLDPEEELDRLRTQCHEGGCDWIHDQPKMSSWISGSQDHRVLWLKGKPGAGKSVLCAVIIEKLRSQRNSVVLHFFHTHASVESQGVRSLMQSLVRQALQSRPDLCTFAVLQYTHKGQQPTLPQLRELFASLLKAFDSVRIVIDGFDECSEKDQRAILDEIELMSADLHHYKRLKILVSSQETPLIWKCLRGRSNIDLSREQAALQTGISAFVRSKVQALQISTTPGPVDRLQMIRIEEMLLNKADGMFLWVRSIVSVLDSIYSIEELENAVNDLPEALEKVQVFEEVVLTTILTHTTSYDRMFARFRVQTSKANLDRALRIFQWLACSQCPLKICELQSAVTLHPGNLTINEEKRVFENIFELCKPFVEVTTNKTVDFVHWSIKEFYIRNCEPLFPILTAQRNIAFSCLAYLNSGGINLIDNDYDEASQMCEIGRGFHDLSRYASEYWVEHVLAYVALCNSEDVSRSDNIVLRAADSLGAELTARHSWSPPDDSEINLDRRYTLITNHESTLTLIRSTLGHTLQGTVAPIEDNESYRSKNPFAAMRKRYDKLCRQLLVADSVPGLKQWELLSFKRTCGASIPSRRNSDCSGSVRGFDTIASRDAHEATHLFVCPHLNCFGHRQGLQSTAELEKHSQEYHPNEERAVRLSSSVVSSETSASIGNTTGESQPQSEPQAAAPTFQSQSNLQQSQFSSQFSPQIQGFLKQKLADEWQASIPKTKDAQMRRTTPQQKSSQVQTGAHSRAQMQNDLFIARNIYNGPSPIQISLSAGQVTNPQSTQMNNASDFMGQQLQNRRTATNQGQIWQPQVQRLQQGEQIGSNIVPQPNDPDIGKRPMNQREMEAMDWFRVHPQFLKSVQATAQSQGIVLPKIDNWHMLKDWVAANPACALGPKVLPWQTDHFMQITNNGADFQVQFMLQQRQQHQQQHQQQLQERVRLRERNFIIQSKELLQ